MNIIVMLQYHRPNPSCALSLQRSWELLAMCLLCFPPTPQFENYLNMWLRLNTGTGTGGGGGGGGAESQARVTLPPGANLPATNFIPALYRSLYEAPRTR